MTTAIIHPRRYFLRKYQKRVRDDTELGIASLYLAKQGLLEGQTYPDYIPYQEKLAAAHYTTLDDIVGADADELVEEAGLTRKEANAVIEIITPFEEGLLMLTRSQFGHPQSGANLVLTLALLKALDVTENINGEVFALSDGRHFHYIAASVLTGDDLFVVEPTTGAGAYVLAPGYTSDVAFPVTFATADAAVLGTLPAGMVARVVRGYWEVTTGFSGGSSSAIGLSSGQTPHNAKGDLLGGAAGDLAATLVAGTYVEGTIGTDNAAGIILRPTATILFDRITSVYTAGAGSAHLLLEVLRNPGA